jgi:hypothetical protein
VNIKRGDDIKVVLIKKASIIKFAPSGAERAKKCRLYKSPSHLPEHPSAGIGTFR